MTVQQLIEELQAQDPAAEVRLMPRWPPNPFECGIRNIISRKAIAKNLCGPCANELKDEPGKPANTVFICEGVRHVTDPSMAEKWDSNYTKR